MPPIQTIPTFQTSDGSRHDDPVKAVKHERYLSVQQMLAGCAHKIGIAIPEIDRFAWAMVETHDAVAAIFAEKLDPPGVFHGGGRVPPGKSYLFGELSGNVLISGSQQEATIADLMAAESKSDRTATPGQGPFQRTKGVATPDRPIVVGYWDHELSDANRRQLRDALFKSIPTGVYFSENDHAFIDATTGMHLDSDFWLEWSSRRWEFPTSKKTALQESALRSGKPASDNGMATFIAESNERLKDRAEQVRDIADELTADLKRELGGEEAA